MTIESLQEIDIVTISEDHGRIYLNISDHLGWDTPTKLLILQQKVNRYLAFIESREMHLQHPQSVQLNPCIKLICMHQPNSNALVFLSQLSEIIEDAGYSFSWQCFHAKLNKMCANKDS